MGFVGRLKERLTGAREQAATPEQPVVETRVRSDADWTAPAGLDPHQANLARIMIRLREHTAQMTPAEAVRGMGMPFGFESEALVPLPGPGREGWTDRKMFEALSRDGDYMTAKGVAGPQVLDAIDRQVVSRLAADDAMPSNFPERAFALRADVTGRVVDFMKDGRRLDERVAAESEMLERQSPGVIQDRFRDMPITSFVPMPDRGENRRRWLEDALRAEHAAAQQGLLSPSAVVRAASHRRGPVEPTWEPAPAIVDRSREAQASVAVEAGRIGMMSEASLRLRFRDVPGSDAAPIPDRDRAEDRRIWVEAALTAQMVRDGMPGPRSIQMSATRAAIALPAQVRQSAPAQDVDRMAARQASRSFAVAAMVGR
jgi:hypothetical protein